MTKPKPKPSGKLTLLGDSAEAMLTAILAEMKKDIKLDAEKRQYSLTDQMKVIDRVAKFEAIRAKIDDDEGGFFDQPPDTQDDPDNEGAEQ